MLTLPVPAPPAVLGEYMVRPCDHRPDSTQDIPNGRGPRLLAPLPCPLLHEPTFVAEVRQIRQKQRDVFVC